MRRRVAFTLALPLFALAAATHGRRAAGTAVGQPPAWLDAYREPAARLIGEAVSGTFAWHRLAVLTDTIGNRLSGTPALDRAIEWAVAEMKQDGLENVHTERVMVPHWVRGSESAEIVEPARHADRRCSGSATASARRPTASRREVLVVHSFEELDAQARDGARAHRPLQRAVHELRRDGARSAPAGRRARRSSARSRCWCASVGPAGLRTPHTGALHYADRRAARFRRRRSPPRTPIACSAWPIAATRVVVRLKMEAHFDADAESANVVGEIRGREQPDEVVVVGGHLDSWDVGAGATDDGGGCVVTWEALRLMKKLNLRPRRTVRVVLWTNEENGGRGGLAYRDQHRAELAQARDDARVRRRRVPAARLRVHRQRRGARHGARRSRRCSAASPPIRSARRRRRRHRAERAGGAHPRHVARGRRLEYFLIHHTPADTIDKIDPVEMAKCAAAVAVMAYVVADLPQRLGE